MSLATNPPIRHDLSFRVDDDQPVAVLWLRADATTPVEVTSAALTLSFDLPDDDEWPLDPDTGLPIPPGQQVVVINGTSAPGDPGGWVVPDGFTDGQVLVIIPHTLWADVEQPWTGSWAVTAVSVDDLQRCLARGVFICEEDS